MIEYRYTREFRRAAIAACAQKITAVLNLLVLVDTSIVTKFGTASRCTTTATTCNTGAGTAHQPPYTKLSAR